MLILPAEHEPILLLRRPSAAQVRMEGIRTRRRIRAERNVATGEEHETVGSRQSRDQISYTDETDRLIRADWWTAAPLTLRRKTRTLECRARSSRAICDLLRSMPTKTALWIIRRRVILTLRRRTEFGSRPGNDVCECDNRRDSMTVVCPLGHCTFAGRTTREQGRERGVC